MLARSATIDRERGRCYFFCNMKATLLHKAGVTLSASRFAEVLIWQLPVPLAGSDHAFKYRLALVVDGTCVLRDDNEAGKGDHKHLGTRDLPYTFIALDRLIDDFWADVARL